METWNWRYQIGCSHRSAVAARHRRRGDRVIAILAWSHRPKRRDRWPVPMRFAVAGLRASNLRQADRGMVWQGHALGIQNRVFGGVGRGLFLGNFLFRSPRLSLQSARSLATLFARATCRHSLPKCRAMTAPQPSTAPTCCRVSAAATGARPPTLPACGFDGTQCGGKHAADLICSPGAADQIEMSVAARCRRCVWPRSIIGRPETSHRHRCSRR
jgi:hypothetical protein